MFFLLILFLVLLAFTAPRWGADSRDGRDWQSREHPSPWSTREDVR